MEHKNQLRKALTALAHQQYQSCIFFSVSYAPIQFFGSMFKESQNLVYLKVAQAAFVQLSETVFVHLSAQITLRLEFSKEVG